MTWLWVTLAFMAGGICGVVAMSCFVMAGQSDCKPKRPDTDKADSN